MQSLIDKVLQDIRDISGRDWLFPGAITELDWLLAHPEYRLSAEEAHKRWWDNLDPEYRRRLEPYETTYAPHPKPHRPKRAMARQAR